MSNEYNEASSSEWKQRLIEMREIPRTMLIKEIGMRDCIHDGEFCLTDKKCWSCDLSEECLEIVDRFENLSDENHMGTILRKTFVARNYMLRKLGGEKHPRVGCRCQGCNWLRELDIVFSEKYEG